MGRLSAEVGRNEAAEALENKIPYICQGGIFGEKYEERAFITVDASRARNPEQAKWTHLNEYPSAIMKELRERVSGQH